MAQCCFHVRHLVTDGAPVDAKEWDFLFRAIFRQRARRDLQKLGKLSRCERLLRVNECVCAHQEDNSHISPVAQTIFPPNRNHLKAARRRETVLRRCSLFGDNRRPFRCAAFRQLVRSSLQLHALSEIMCPSVRPIVRAMREPRRGPQSTVFPAQPCRP